MKQISDEIEVREIWAIRFGDGTFSGGVYGTGAEQKVRASALDHEEIVHRTETIARTPWRAA